jgi:hypothetical protein
VSLLEGRGGEAVRRCGILYGHAGLYVSKGLGRCFLVNATRLDVRVGDRLSWSRMRRVESKCGTGEVR